MRWLFFSLLQTLSFQPFHYTTQHASGWSLWVHHAYQPPQHRYLKRRVFDIMSVQLQACQQVLPKHAVAKLRHTRFWINYHPHPACKGHSGVFRLGPPKAFIQRNLHPLQSNAIEICGAKRFFDTAHTTPALLLHELSHAYHILHTTPTEKALIQHTYQRALRKGLYRKVPMYKARPKLAYARLNAYEYFAELSESYFGRNNAYPFNRQQLKQYDPSGYNMIKRVWHIKRTPHPYHVQYGYGSYPFGQTNKKKK